MPVPKPDDYMTVEECAAVARMTVAGFRRLCNDGKLRCSKVGRRWLIRTADFQAWLEGQAVKPADGPVRLAGGRELPREAIRQAAEAADDAEHTRRAAARPGSGLRGDEPLVRPRIIG